MPDEATPISLSKASRDTTLFVLLHHKDKHAARWDAVEAPMKNTGTVDAVAVRRTSGI
jgi:hypothetical protein